MPRLDLKKLTVVLNVSLFLRFCLVGCSNVVVTLIAFSLLHSVLAINYLFASVLAYSLGIVNSFAWNKLWTFKMRGSNVKREFVRFMGVNLAGLGINSCFMLLLVGVVGVNALISQVIAVGLVFVFNFFLVRLMVFPRVS